MTRIVKLPVPILGLQSAVEQTTTMMSTSHCVLYVIVIHLSLTCWTLVLWILEKCLYFHNNLFLHKSLTIATFPQSFALWVAYSPMWAWFRAVIWISIKGKWKQVRNMCRKLIKRHIQQRSSHGSFLLSAGPQKAPWSILPLSWALSLSSYIINAKNILPLPCRYGAQGITLSKIVPHICNLLGDPTSQVGLWLFKND